MFLGLSGDFCGFSRWLLEYYSILMVAKVFVVAWVLISCCEGVLDSC